jgi:glutaredoxin
VQREHGVLNELTNRIKEMSKVLIKSRDDCHYCSEAKMFLQGMEVDFEVQHQPTGQVPQVYIGDHHVGGYNDLVDFSMTQEFDKLINE